MDSGKKGKFEERDALKVRTRGELIAAIRKRLGYSQEELEWKSGVSKTQISRIERDLTNPGIGTIKRLEKALDVPLMDLFVNPEDVNQDIMGVIILSDLFGLRELYVSATFYSVNLFIGHKANCRNIWRLET